MVSASGEVALDVKIVNFADGMPTYVILTNDEVLKVTEVYDEDGDPVMTAPIDTLWQTVAWCVAGPSADGYWFTVELAEFANYIPNTRVN